MTDRERELHLLVEVGASQLGGRVLAATDRDELDEILDELILSSDLDHLNELAVKAAMELPSFPTDAMAEFVEDIAGVVGVEAARALTDAAELIRVWTDAQLSSLAAIGDDSGPLRDLPAISVLDPELPPEIAQALIGARRAALTQLALIRALRKDEPLEPWLASALVSRFVDGVRAHLALIAALVPVPEHVVPASARLNLADISARHEHSRRIDRETLEAARAAEQGLGVEGDRAGQR